MLHPTALIARETAYMYNTRGAELCGDLDKAATQIMFAASIGKYQTTLSNLSNRQDVQLHLTGLGYRVYDRGGNLDVHWG